jgi:pantetheine-phosphate adenylyltransferase
VIIGITGGSGAGQTAIAGLLAARLGCPHIDADKVYHGLLTENKSLRADLAAEFGTAERAELAPIVFGNAEKLARLTEITLPYTTAAIRAAVPSTGGAVLDVPLLFESGLAEACDITVAVLAQQGARILRLAERGLPREAARARIEAQPSDSFYAKAASIVVHNNGNLQAAADTLFQQLTRRVAVFGGTFDPPHAGHLDIIRRAAALFSRVYVCVLINPDKSPTLSAAERVAQLKELAADVENAKVSYFDGLLVEFAKQKNAGYTLRGIRGADDEAYERDMYQQNLKIAAEHGHQLETIYFPAAPHLVCHSSTRARKENVNGGEGA